MVVRPREERRGLYVRKGHGTSDVDAEKRAQNLFSVHRKRPPNIVNRNVYTCLYMCVHMYTEKVPGPNKDGTPKEEGGVGRRGDRGDAQIVFLSLLFPFLDRWVRGREEYKSSSV